MTRRDIFNRNLIGKKTVKPTAEIKDMLDAVVGRRNEIIEGKCE